MIPLYHLIKYSKKKNGVKYYFLPSVKWQKAPLAISRMFCPCGEHRDDERGEEKCGQTKKACPLYYQKK